MYIFVSFLGLREVKTESSTWNLLVPARLFPAQADITNNVLPVFLLITVVTLIN
jgi:hypothetical protein